MHIIIKSTIQHHIHTWAASSDWHTWRRICMAVIELLEQNWKLNKDNPVGIIDIMTQLTHKWVNCSVFFSSFCPSSIIRQISRTGASALYIIVADSLTKRERNWFYDATHLSFLGDKHADASRFSLLYHFENLKLITRILDISGMQLLGVTSICFELSELRLLLVSRGKPRPTPSLHRVHPFENSQSMAYNVPRYRPYRRRVLGRKN